MDGEAQVIHSWDATSTLWNPLTLDSQAVGAGQFAEGRKVRVRLLFGETACSS